MNESKSKLIEDLENETKKAVENCRAIIGNIRKIVEGIKFEAEQRPEVIHASWKSDQSYLDGFADKGFFCTNCMDNYPRKSDYCPNCGAKMDLKE